MNLDTTGEERVIWSLIGVNSKPLKINWIAIDELEVLMEHSIKFHKFWELNSIFEKFGD